LAAGLHAEALEQFERAVDAYSSGLNTMRRPSDMEDADIRAKRGYARLRAHTAKSDTPGAAALEELDEIVADLECGEIDPFSGLTPLPEALFWRATYLRSTGRLEEAIVDLTRAIKVSPIDTKAEEAGLVTGRARCQLAECHLEQCLQRDDIPAMESALRSLLVIDSAFDPSIPLLASAIRRMVSLIGHRDAASLIRDTSAKMLDIMKRPHCVGLARRFAATYTAAVILRLGDLINEAELRRVCELYTAAVEGADELLAPETLALAADSKVKLAKMLLEFGDTAEESRLLFEDATELLETSISVADRASQAYDVRVAHSKLGEALLRLGSLSGDVRHARSAAQHLERSRSLGNDAPELHGLLGDCYYRVGRANSDISQLRRASDEKALARRGAAESSGNSVSLRENWSITARIEEALWQHAGERASVAASIRATLRAHVSDTHWPWPIFQLASLHRSLGAEFDHSLCVSEEFEGSDPRLKAALEHRNAESLEEFGAILAVEDEEFRRRVLGGRTQVYVLDDPHGLLSETIVLKRNTLANAEREATDARSFGRYLQLCGADANFSIARPLAVVPLNNDRAVYAMQHVKGRELGVLISRGHHIGRPLLNDVVNLLAWFHAWSWGQRVRSDPQPPHQLRRFALEISQSWLQLGR
jgi:tetratricopeptide (TPR) repeat protein